MHTNMQKLIVYLIIAICYSIWVNCTWPDLQCFKDCMPNCSTCRLTSESWQSQHKIDLAALCAMLVQLSWNKPWRAWCHGYIAGAFPWGLWSVWSASVDTITSNKDNTSHTFVAQSQAVFQSQILPLHVLVNIVFRFKLTNQAKVGMVMHWVPATAASQTNHRKRTLACCKEETISDPSNKQESQVCWKAEADHSDKHVSGRIVYITPTVP